LFNQESIFEAQEQSWSGKNQTPHTSTSEAELGRVRKIDSEIGSDD